MIGVSYGEPWNCPDPEPVMIRLMVDLRPPVDLRDWRLRPGFVTVIEEESRMGWRDWLWGFMLDLAEGTDP